MSHTLGAGSKPGTLTDREIAEDILTSQKYISNYYYAPAVLESTDPNIRNTFQRMHNETQSQAKQVFDYLNSKGWYKPRQADPQSVNDLRNAAQESRQVLSSIAGEMSDLGGKSKMMGNPDVYSHGSSSNLPGGGWQSQPSGWHSQPQSQGFQTNIGQQSQMRTQSFQTGTGWQPTYSQTPQWTGTQRGEGQSGMGPSSLAQGASWGGQPSWMQSGPGTLHSVYGSQGVSSLSQRPVYGGYGTSLVSPSQSFQTGTGWQPTYSQSPQWTGTQRGEGQSGMGPSSLGQWASWGGQPSWIQSGTGTGWQPTYSQTPQWTGTQAGEGQSGMGPSSLAQWTRWGGQPSWIQNQPGTQGQWR
jgi:hypothetical protein